MRIYGCVDFDYISLEDLCDFVMEMFGSRGRRRVHSTEALESLRYKNSRSGCLARVTTLCRATEALLEDAKNVEEVSKKLLEVNEAFGRFEKAHYKYIATLTGDLEEIESEGRYFQEHCQRKDIFDLNIKRWINEVKSRPRAREGKEIRPEDSISVTGSLRSRNSTRVSIKQLKAKEALARLKIEQLKEKQALLRKEEEMKMERQFLEAKYELEQAVIQVKILEEDYSVSGGAVPNMFEPPGSCAGGVSSKRVVEPKVKDVKAYIKNTEVKRGDNDFTRSRLNPHAKEFTHPVVKQDRELSPTDSVDSDFAIVEDVLDKLGSTIRQEFALPKPDLSIFDGNPLEYWSFFRSFENTVVRNAMSESEKLMYLLQYTTGDAKKTIECCVVMNTSKGYMAARKLLQERFGHPYTIASKFVGEITEGPQIKPSDRTGLLEFADRLKNCEHTLESMGYLDEINSADNLRRIVQRLPFHLRTKFVEVEDTIQQSGRRPSIKDISGFVAAKCGNQGNQSSCGSGSGHLNAKILDCPACNWNHVLMKCQNFERKTFDEHAQIMRKAQLCHNCFQYGHIARGCLAKGACQVYGCKRRHHTLLHPPFLQRSNVNQASEESATQSTQTPPSPRDAQAAQATSLPPTQGGQSNTTLARSGKVCLRIVPVKVRSRDSNKELLSYALLDNGSDVHPQV